MTVSDMAKAKLLTLMDPHTKVSGRMDLERDSENSSTKTAQFTEEIGKLTNRMGKER